MGAPGVEDAVIVIEGPNEPGKLADIAILIGFHRLESK